MQTARAPFGQVSRRFDGSHRGMNPGEEHARMPLGPSTTVSRMSLAVPAISSTLRPTPRLTRSMTQPAAARVFPAPLPAT
jgi:hypothetical protein